ncbi:MAG: prephenate dehydrogenase [Clostridia bacterium]|nr:prephenate dehydrogenase [Clostridia bacterium]
MKMMIIGLGLIGGSMAMALSGTPDLEITTVTRNPVSRADALRMGIVKNAWPTPDLAPIEDQDLVVLCLPPDACLEFVKQEAMRLKPGAILTDVCGVKKPLYAAVNALPPHDFIYLGGHPMAGKERGSFANAFGELYRGSHYILTPDASVPQSAIDTMTRLIHAMGCADIIFTTPVEHDERIGYTSQLMHVMALALCDQHLLFDSFGFEGNSFRGATRVAALDPDLWCELFMANKETLADLTDELIRNLSVYRDLLLAGDREKLLAQLKVSSDRKKEFDRLMGIEHSKTTLYK